MANSMYARPWRHSALRVATTIAMSGLIMVALLFASRSTANTAADMRNLELGLPLAWTIQDQSYFNPPSFPHEVSFASPWEHPTTVNVPAMLINMLIVSAILWLMILAWQRLSVRNRRL